MAYIPETVALTATTQPVTRRFVIAAHATVQEIAASSASLGRKNQLIHLSASRFPPALLLFPIILHPDLPSTNPS